VLFSEPKILNSSPTITIPTCAVSFSALQRAENSQSRISFRPRGRACLRFSALQRAENSQFGYRPTYIRYFLVSVLFSEPKILNLAGTDARRPHRQVSVLFSEPKILNRTENGIVIHRVRVSVLFSEPKILNAPNGSPTRPRLMSFSALQRAENSQLQARPPDR